MKIVIYNVWHQKLFPELVNEIPANERNQLVLYGVNEEIEKEMPNPEDPNFKGFEIMLEYNLPIYEPKWQRKNYCQTSAFVHIYKNNIAIDQNIDYIGCTQYDYKFKENSFSKMRQDIAAHPNKTVLFYIKTLPMRTLMSNLNEWNDALTSYNQFFHTNFTWEKIEGNPRLYQKHPIGHAFVIPTPMFQKMMSWMTVYLEQVEETDYLPGMSQAEFAERIHGLFLALECENENTIMLPCSEIEDLHEKYFPHQNPWKNYKRKL